MRRADAVTSGSFACGTDTGATPSALISADTGASFCPWCTRLDTRAVTLTLSVAFSLEPRLHSSVCSLNWFTESALSGKVGSPAVGGVNVLPAWQNPGTAVISMPLGRVMRNVVLVPTVPLTENWTR